jgi:hypothetical protein
MVAGNRMGFELHQSSFNLFGCQFHFIARSWIQIGDASEARPSHPAGECMSFDIAASQKFDRTLGPSGC